MNKKGNFPDVFEYLKVALLLGIVITIVLVWLSNWTTSISSMDNETIPQVVKDGASEFETYSFKGFDYFFAFLYVAFVGFSVVAARIIPSSPKFLFVAFFVFIFIVFASMIIENIWSGFIANPTIAVVTNQLTIIPFFLDKLVFFALGYAMLVGVALYTKSDEAGGGLF